MRLLPFTLLSLITLVLSWAPLVQAGEVALTSLKTFGTIGKEVTPLSAGKEAELFRHSSSG